MRFRLLTGVLSLCLPALAAWGGTLPGDLPRAEPLTVLVVDADGREAYVRNAGRSGQRFTAFSTFKVPNALIALDSGVVADAESVFLYDADKHAHPRRPEPAYNRDQTLVSALRHSVLWVFQEIAREVGEKRYRDYLQRFHFGNQDLSGGLDQFWLTSLEISAAEQVRFLIGFHRNAFALDPAAVTAVKEMMLLEETPDYRLYGKTGTGRHGEDDRWLGWIVGFAESRDRLLFYAINLEADSYPELRDQRMRLLRESLASAGIPLR